MLLLCSHTRCLDWSGPEPLLDTGLLPGRAQGERTAAALPCTCAARKEMGLTDTKNKKLSASALRTMESVYARTPFPSGDVIK